MTEFSFMDDLLLHVTKVVSYRRRGLGRGFMGQYGLDTGSPDPQNNSSPFALEAGNLRYSAARCEFSFSFLVN